MQHYYLNIDGETIKNQSYNYDSKDWRKMELPKDITLGGEHNGSAVDWGLFGKVADLNIWTRIIQENEIKQYTDPQEFRECDDINTTGKVTYSYLFNKKSDGPLELSPVNIPDWFQGVGLVHGVNTAPWTW